MLRFNPARVESKMPGLVTPGWHVAKVLSCTEQTSSKGNLMWVLDLMIVDGASDGKTMREWMSLTEAARWRIKWALAEMGFDMDRDAEVEIEPDDLRNRTLGIEVEHVKSDKTDDEGNRYVNAKVKGFCRPEDVADNIKRRISDGKGLEISKDDSIPF